AELFLAVERLVFQTQAAGVIALDLPPRDNGFVTIITNDAVADAGRRRNGHPGPAFLWLKRPKDGMGHRRGAGGRVSVPGWMTVDRRMPVHRRVGFAGFADSTIGARLPILCGLAQKRDDTADNTGELRGLGAVVQLRPRRAAALDRDVRDLL